MASSSPFPGPWVFRRWLVFLLVFGVFPSPLSLDSSPVLKVLPCCEQQRERAAQLLKEPQRGVHSLDGKVKRNHLNTPRYEYSDVYTHGD